MQIIDFHCHIYPKAIAEKAAQSICDFYELEGGHMDGTVQTLLKQGNEAGIDRFVVLPVGMRPDKVRHVNDFIVKRKPPALPVVFFLQNEESKSSTCSLFCIHEKHTTVCFSEFVKLCLFLYVSARIIECDVL